MDENVARSPWAVKWFQCFLILSSPDSSSDLIINPLGLASSLSSGFDYVWKHTPSALQPTPRLQRERVKVACGGILLPYPHRRCQLR